MNSYPTAIGIDIGRYHVTSAVINSGGEVLLSCQTDLADVQDRNYLVQVVTEAIKEIRASAAAKRLNPVCTGVSAKGFIDSSLGNVLGPDRGISGWTNVPLAKLLNRETALPVYVGNDANLMTLAEHRFGAARGHKNVIFLSLRTGIGGGIIIGGKLYRGVNNSGGEFGQMIIDIKGDKNKEGIQGTLESLASSQALVDRYMSLCDDSTEKKRTGMRARDVFDLHYEGDKDASKAVMENARYIGVGVSNLISVFAPEIIVLGGGMARAGEDYIEEIRRTALSNILDYYRDHIIITRAELGQGAAITGAALFALSRLGGKMV
jgi:glucokinase